MNDNWVQHQFLSETSEFALGILICRQLRVGGYWYSTEIRQVCSNDCPRNPTCMFCSAREDESIEDLFINCLLVQLQIWHIEHHIHVLKVNKNKQVIELVYGESRIFRHQVICDCQQKFPKNAQISETNGNRLKRLRQYLNHGTTGLRMKYEGKNKKHIKITNFRILSWR